jgi:hypothetical protein
VRAETLTAPVETPEPVATRCAANDHRTRCPRPATWRLTVDCPNGHRRIRSMCDLHHRATELHFVTCALCLVSAPDARPLPKLRLLSRRRIEV